MTFLKSFAAGFASTLAFHQGLLWELHRLGSTPRAPWNFAPVPPFGVPAVISLAFFGGLWAIALAWLIQEARGSRYWLLWTLLGALGPSVVAWMLVMPLKGMAMAAGGDPKLMIGALLLNAAWGAGCALFLRLLPH